MKETDETLVMNVRRGDMKSFEVLYARYEKPLFLWVKRWIPQDSVAEEMFHETWMKVLKSESEDFSKGSFKGWIFQVARNLCLNHLKRANRWEAEMDDEQVYKRKDAESFGNQIAQELASDLKEAAHQLPQSLRGIYQMRMKGMTIKEMSEVLNIPEGTVKSRMHQMVGVLKEALRA